MRFASYVRADGTATWGIEYDGGLLDAPAMAHACDVDMPTSLLDLIQTANGAPEGGLDRLSMMLSTGRVAPHVHDLSRVRLLAPLPVPARNVIALGLNYREHAQESRTGSGVPDLPVYFTKATTAVTGPDAPVVADERLTTQLDWEVELGVIVGKGGRWIPQERALEHVFGYTIVNDLSARDLQHGRPRGQWFLGKSLDGSCPMGPVLVSTDELVDPQTLDVSLRVNGTEKQRSNTSRMIFSVAAIIADLSKYMTLIPGDIISTGTPSGVGAARTPPEFLRPGDFVEAEIERIGVLRTQIIAPPTPAGASSM